MSWQNLIQQQANLPTPCFPDQSRPVLAPLADSRIICVSGDEAASFLQNLLTNDVNALNMHQAQLSGLCSPKGRLLAIFQLIRREQDFLIVLPAELSEAIAQRLNMFKLRSKVDISLSETMVAVGISNPNNTFNKLPTDVMQGAQSEHGLLIKQAGDSLRFLLICEQENMISVADWLSDGWELASQAFWQLQDIEAGLPMIFNDSKEQFTPQQVNLDLVGGVSFKKGCYPGQEVVARLHYLGTPSRRMFLGKLNTKTLPAVYTPVTDQQGNTLGHVVQAQINTDNKVVCQLSMKLAARQTPALIENQEVENIVALAEDAV